MDVEGNEAFRVGSPHLYERERLEEAEPGAHTILRECPFGYVLRNAPHVLRVIGLANEIENGSLSQIHISPWARAAAAVVGNERARLREAEQEQRKQRSDSSRALSVLGSRHG